MSNYIFQICGHNNSKSYLSIPLKFCTHLFNNITIYVILHISKSLLENYFIKAFFLGSSTKYDINNHTEFGFYFQINRTEATMFADREVSLRSSQKNVLCIGHFE